MNKETGMYCVYNKKGEKVKEFKDKKDAVAYATKNHDALMKDSVNTADKKPETYRKPDGKMGTRMVPTDREVVREGTEIGQTKWAEVKRFAGGDKMGGMGIQISGLNGQGKSTMDQIRQKGAYIQLPLKEVPKLIKLLQQAVRSKDESTEVNEAMTPAQKDAHAKAIAAFKARGGKITKLPPGKAAGYHGKEDPGHGVHGMLSKPDSGKFNTKKKVKSMTADTQKEDMQVYRIGHSKVQGNVHARDEKHATDILRKKGLKGPIRLTHRGPVANRPKPQRRPLSNNTQKESVDMKSFFDVRKAATLDVNQLDEYMGGGGMSGFQGQANRNKYGEHGANPHHHDAHATAAYKSGMRSKSAIVKHVEKQTGQKIHPDVHRKIHNTPGMKD